ncbi:hypothetical protein AQUCO_05700116v1 [Aquilegia coerulea]|uniref:Uncharacterized protein n=1 Tax=Aquilegia coerulea TaxID=218851 RepID=A0A2G5CH69_AQUCA|nr:hypothetical protein AQUCO_05700116v1 [Aquilegia coerulea]
MVTLPLASLHSSLLPTTPSSSSSNKSCLNTTRRNSIILASSILASFLDLSVSNTIPSSYKLARALDVDEFQEQEDRVVHLFQETSPSVVLIRDIEIDKNFESTNEVMLPKDEDVKIEGTGSGFVWDKAGHIVTNYHVIEKLATNASGLQRCKVLFVDTSGNSFSKEGKLIGFDPAYDLAVLKVDVEGNELKPVMLGGEWIGQGDTLS